MTLAFRSTVPLLYGAEPAHATAFACPLQSPTPPIDRAVMAQKGT